MATKDRTSLRVIPGWTLTSLIRVFPCSYPTCCCLSLQFHSSKMSSTQINLELATSPNNFAAIPTLAEEILPLAKALAKDDYEARHKLLLKARSLVQALETPRETMLKHTWAQPGVFAGIITGADVGLWERMAEKPDDIQKVPELAEAVGMDSVLLGRLLRHLAAMGYLIEVGHDEYRLTNFAKCLSLPVMSAGYESLQVDLSVQMLCDKCELIVP
jgi:hypothetical protein